MDFKLHDAGKFNAITEEWVHSLLVVTPTSMITYEDGVIVPAAKYGFFKSYQSKARNNAYPNPSKLNTAMKSMTLRTAIYIGGRADQHKDRHFHGTVAGLAVMTSAVRYVRISCMSFCLYETVCPRVRVLARVFSLCEYQSMWACVCFYCYWA